MYFWSSSRLYLRVNLVRRRWNRGGEKSEGLLTIWSEEETVLRDLTPPNVYRHDGWDLPWVEMWDSRYIWIKQLFLGLRIFYSESFPVSGSGTHVWHRMGYTAVSNICEAEVPKALGSWYIFRGKSVRLYSKYLHPLKKCFSWMPFGAQIRTWKQVIHLPLHRTDRGIHGTDGDSICRDT